jgi:hypothetical protein
MDSVISPASLKFVMVIESYQEAGVFSTSSKKLEIRPVNIMKPVQKAHRLLTYPAAKKSLFIAVFNLSFYTALLCGA